MYDGGGTEQAQMDICFTPLGRTFASLNDLTSPTQPPPTPMVGAARFTIPKGLKSSRVYLNRAVVILPNGTSRLAL